MSLSYLETSLDQIEAAARDDVIEICINPDGSCWGEFQGDHFMRPLDEHLSVTEVHDLGNQIASSANTTMSKDKPIVSVSISYRNRPIRAQVITPPAVISGMSISLRFFSSLPLAYSTTCGHLFHAHVASHSMTCGHTREVICEAVSS